MLRRDSPIPLFYQLSELLRKQIESGIIQYGEKLESESQMMRQYEIGRMTVRSALLRLVNMGYLRKEHGSGTFCCYVPPQPKRTSIDVLLNVGDAYFVPYYMRSIAGVFARAQFDMVVSDTRNSMDEIEALLNRIVEAGSNGIILQPCYDTIHVSDAIVACYRRIFEARIPFLMIDSAYPLEDASYMMLNEAEGGRIAANHLLDLQHDRAAILYYADRQDALLRRQGFLEVYRERANAAPREYALGRGGIDEMIHDLRKGLFTAVFCYNDEVAADLMHRLKTEGVSVPEDVSILGFDDSLLAPATEPPLSSITHPKQRLGEEAARVMVEFVKGSRTPPYQKLFAPCLSPRATCAVNRQSGRSCLPIHATAGPSK